MQRQQRFAFLFDVDNTLLDNDALKTYLSHGLARALGAAGADQFWRLYEEVRRERDVVDMPLTASRFAVASHRQGDERLIEDVVETLPFRDFVYPGALQSLQHVSTFGPAAILSDGDQVFQRAKIIGSGLAEAVQNRVLIYEHKEQHMPDVLDFLPAERLVLIDDKAAILASVKGLLQERVTTVHVAQGHYAQGPSSADFTPDLQLSSIADLASIGEEAFWNAPSLG